MNPLSGSTQHPRSLGQLRSEKRNGSYATTLEKSPSPNMRTAKAADSTGSQASFPKVRPDAKRIELVIKDLAAVKETVFRWNLE